MKKMPAGEFKARCLSVMDKVCATGESVIITKRGKPVAKLVPVKSDADDIFGFMKGEAKIVGDIVSPAVPAEDWEILKEDSELRDE